MDYGQLSAINSKSTSTILQLPPPSPRPPSTPNDNHLLRPKQKLSPAKYNEVTPNSSLQNPTKATESSQPSHSEGEPNPANETRKELKPTLNHSASFDLKFQTPLSTTSSVTCLTDRISRSRKNLASLVDLTVSLREELKNAEIEAENVETDCKRMISEVTEVKKKVDVMMNRKQELDKVLDDLRIENKKMEEILGKAQDAVMAGRKSGLI